MGCSLSLRQEELLRLAKRLVSKMSTWVIEVPDCSQPDHLDAEQVRCLCTPGGV
jgi:hypothetical protein